MSTAPLYEGSDNDDSSCIQEEPTNTPLNNLPGEFRSALDEFRDNWQRELKNSDQASHVEPIDTVENEALEALDLLSPLANILEANETEKQELAVKLFRKAVELEQKGKVYDAVPLYRRAVQIVPDIEFKFYDHQNALKSTAVASKVINTETSLGNSITEKDIEEENVNFFEDLYEKFQIDVAQDYKGQLILSSRDAGVISTEMHISDLPPEILLYILRWVVSNQLDMQSLEQCAAVCKGLYLCARDEDLWRLACFKVWGANVGTPSEPFGDSTSERIETVTEPDVPTFNSWRQMFMDRERVLFSGCYISKTTYLRLGENSFQDQYYRPVQLVEYYRYVRFLPDGTVLMMTNADEPTKGVTKLKNLQQLRPEILKGYYRLYGDTITIILKKQNSMQQQQRYLGRQRRGSLAHANLEDSTKYCIEFRILNSSKRKFAQLIWLNYSVKQVRNKVESTSEFDLNASKYPALWFSPVRSYHMDAEAPLT